MEETTTLDAAAYTTAGKSRERVSLPSDVFDGTVNMPVMHAAVKAFLANQRLGLAATKTRGLVVGGNQKPWRQKGTGRARSGSSRSPVWVGGGTVFGPTPRGYTHSLPKKVRALARKSALNARARENALVVVEALNYDKPSTRQLVTMIEALGGANKKVLLLTDGVKPNVFLSGRNITDTHVMPYSDVSTYHLLWSDIVIVESGALGSSAAVSASDESDEDDTKPADSASKRKGSGKTAKKAAAKKSGRKTAAKSAARKTATKKTAKKSAPKKKGK
jgi:large subunit ribosomal protein L4